MFSQKQHGEASNSRGMTGKERRQVNFIACLPYAELFRYNGEKIHIVPTLGHSSSEYPGFQGEDRVFLPLNL